MASDDCVIAGFKIVGSDKHHNADAFGRNQRHQYDREKDGQFVLFTIMVFRIILFTIIVFDRT